MIGASRLEQLHDTLSAVGLKIDPGLKATLDDLTTVYRRVDAVR